MSSGFTSFDFTRQGALNVAAYLPNPDGASISAPSAPGVQSYQFGLNELLVKNGNAFNINNPVPGSQRAVKVCFASYNIDGHIAFTDFSAETNVTPASSDNCLVVNIDNVPALAIYAFVFVDGQLANWLQTPPQSRRGGVAGLSMQVVIPYEPNPTSLSAAELLDLRPSNGPKEIKRYSLGETTGALTHLIDLTKIDIPVNDLPNETLTTRTSQKITGTFKGPKSRLQALFTGGTAYIGCGNTCAVNNITQIGWKSGNCDDGRVYELTFPGDSCYKQLDAVLFAKATQGDASQEVNYSSDEASHLPFTLMEAPSSLFKGQHTLSLVTI